jgi:hypothetical protein
MREVWSNTNRFSQTGYSAGTIFPEIQNYGDDMVAFEEDMKKAEMREESHNEWLEDERREARIEYLMERDSCRADDCCCYEKDECYGDNDEDCDEEEN